MMRPARGTHRIWTAPILVAFAMLAGLVGALLTENALMDGLAALILFGALAWSVGLGLRSPRTRDRGLRGGPRPVPGTGSQHRAGG